MTGDFLSQLITVNVDIFAQYIFSRISCRALDARKFHVNENYYHNRTNRIKWYMRENLAVRICLLMLDARKSSCAKICTFTVYNLYDISLVLGRKRQNRSLRTIPGDYHL